MPLTESMNRMKCSLLICFVGFRPPRLHAYNYWGIQTRSQYFLAIRHPNPVPWKYNYYIFLISNYFVVTDEGVFQIIDKCKDLYILDIEGSRKITDKLREYAKTCKHIIYVSVQWITLKYYNIAFLVLQIKYNHVNLHREFSANFYKSRSGSRVRSPTALH